MPGGGAWALRRAHELWNYTSLFKISRPSYIGKTNQQLVDSINLLKISCNPSVYKHLHRNIHSSRVLNINPKQVEEVKIPVPWGHIAGKWWGDKNKQPVLALHGWQDNADTFDPLLELLPDSMSVLAIDFPGHGFSSHFSNGMFYHFYDLVMSCCRVQDYYKWNELTILAHSAGGGVAFILASVFPERVKTIMNLDIIKPIAQNQSHYDNLRKTIGLYLTKGSRQLSDNPKYTMEEIENRWLEKQVVKGSLTLDSVRVLCQRGVQLDSKSGKYFFTRDSKLVLPSLQYLSEDQLLEMAKKLRCNFLVVKCRDSQLIDTSLKSSPDFINTVTQSAKSFKIVEVEGTHHVHLNNPERVAPVISEFLNSVDS